MIQGVMIDSREPEWVQRLRFGCTHAAVAPLDTGDAWLSTADNALVVVERKTSDDLLGSIKDGRLLVQAHAMRRKTPWAYLVITGPLYAAPDGTARTERATKWAWSSVQGALLSVQEMGVMIAHAAQERDYEETVIRLAQRKRDAQKVIPPAADPRVMSPQEAILTAMPGIGYERARVLLDYWDGDVAHALCWLTWLGTFAEVEGIGDGIKKGVRHALGLPPDCELMIYSPESLRHMQAYAQGATA
jgi:ERCC4-type nuclease